MNALYEVVALRPATELPADIQGTILQIAADRWLILDQQPALPAGFAITDVTGKWREIRLTSATAARLLANTVDIDALLAGRDCARTALFDCPAILARLDTGYSVWVERSYEHAFNVAVERAAAL
jgi:sarcosine oxidase gamma subunit